ncbi:DUF3023 domain-containing protein [Ehrlichia chaffeensis]|uniref:DUF3023 domain-containing protein n=1 Tax=Ehrlichia chaffeensis TaxID=945 RepID=UPI000444AB88|nr:DUF3023 domain-containing protein [Ehrlichia chaffeensis]AHX09591.1 hypothetical protein ECHWAK_0435 [Ehrlichia chaffeensis str. Wakulla]
MFNNRNVQNRKTYNKALCSALSSCYGIRLKSAYVIGNTEGERMLVHASKTHKDPLYKHVPASGSVLFLLKGSLSKDQVLNNPELRGLLGSSFGMFTRSLKFQCYLLVPENRVNRFYAQVFLETSLGNGRSYNNLGCYGNIILGHVHGGPYSNVFDETKDLATFVGLDATFLVSKSVGSCCYKTEEREFVNSSDFVDLETGSNEEQSVLQQQSNQSNRRLERVVAQLEDVVISNVSSSPGVQR